MEELVPRLERRGLTNRDVESNGFSTNRVFQQRDSLEPKILNKKVSDAETQTVVSLTEEKPRLNFNSVVSKTKPISSVQPSTSQRNEFTTVPNSRKDPEPIRCKPKRPAWDIDGRIQDFKENYRATKKYSFFLEDQLEMCIKKIKVLESTNSVLLQDFEEKSIQSEEATSQIEELKSQLKKKTEELEKQKANYEYSQNCYQEEINGFKSQITSLTSMKFGVQAQLEAAELLVEDLRGQIKQLECACKDKDSKIELQCLQISDMDSKIRQEELKIQELKGNIRVFCRLRPPLPDENGMVPANIVPVSEKTIEIQQLPEE